jgi:hypothetical protein
MQQSIELRDVLQAVSVLVAAGSVIFAVITYKRSRITQQITALRGALGDSRRKVDTLSQLFSEAGACQVGVSVGNQLKEMFGPDLAVDQLAALLADKGNYDIIITAIHEGYLKTSVSAEIDEAIDKFSNVDVSLRTLAPNTSFIMSAGHRIITDIVRLVYSTGHLKQVFDDDGNNLATTTNSLLKKTNINLAYADVADSISRVPVQMVQSGGRNVFTQARKLLEVPSDKLMALTDDELRKYFRSDKQHTTASRDVSTIPASVSTASQILDTITDLFTPRERDEMIRAVAQLEVLLKEFSGAKD